MEGRSFSTSDDKVCFPTVQETKLSFEGFPYYAMFALDIYISLAYSTLLKPSIECSQPLKLILFKELQAILHVATAAAVPSLPHFEDDEQSSLVRLSCTQPHKPLLSVL